MSSPHGGKRILIFAVLVGLMVNFTPAAAQLVLVVSKDSPLDSLSSKEIRKIFKGQSLVHAENRPLQIVEYAPESERFYKILFNQSSYSIAKHWLRLIFSGERVVPPKSFSDAKKLCKYVSQTSNAVSFLPVSFYERFRLQFPIKAIVVDGRSYRDRGYLFSKK